MKKILLTLVATLVMTSSAFAVMNPDDDIMGMYWDTDANDNCAISYSGVSLLYIIMTNPTFDYLYGFECGFDIEATNVPYILGATFANSQALDVAAGFQNFIVGFGAPTTCSEATLLVSLEIGNFSGVDLNFFLHESNPASIEGNLPVVLKVDDELVQLGTSTLPGSITAYMSPNCGVATVNSSWDSVKSMYR